MNEFGVSSFMEMLYEDATAAAQEPLAAVNEWNSYKERQLCSVRKVLKLDKLERLYGRELSWRKLESFMTEDILVTKYKVDAVRNLSIAVYTMEVPGKNPDEAVVILKGHSPIGARESYLSVMGGKSLAAELAHMGYLAVIPEIFGFGEAKKDGMAEDCDACESCNSVEPALIHMGFNLVGLRVLEGIKTLDFIQEALGIQKFGVFGASGGGHVCNYLGVLDKRIGKMIAAAYPNLYKYSILSIKHCICNYVPEQMELGESYYVTSLAAPDKKLLLINGEQDPIFPVQGSRIAFDYVGQVYKELGAGKNFTGILFEGEHEVSVPKVCQWLKDNA